MAFRRFIDKSCKLSFLAFSICILSLVWVFSGHVSGPAEGTLVEIEPPPGAVIAGLTRLDFNEDFDDPATAIDWNRTRESGAFSFYPTNRDTPTGDLFEITDSVLTIREASAGALRTTSTFPEGGSSFGPWHGYAPRGATYAEARIRFPVHTSPSPVAFWTMSAFHTHSWNDLTNNWQNPGDNPIYNYLENDYMEWKFDWNGVNGYLHTVHLWTQDGTVNPPSGTRTSVQYPSRGISVPGTNWDEWHAYGCLWLPGDRLDTYFDNVLVRSYVFSDHPSLLSRIEEHYNDPLPIIIGGGGEEYGGTTRFDYVRVWRAP